MTWPPTHRDDNSAPFYGAAAGGELLLRHCPACPSALAPESLTCPFCGCAELDWTTAGTTATLVSWAVVRRAPNAAYAELVPYVIGLVELADGPWMYARITGCTADTLEVGLPLEVTFERPADSEAYPVFQPSPV